MLFSTSHPGAMILEGFRRIGITTLINSVSLDPDAIDIGTEESDEEEGRSKRNCWKK